MKIHERNWRNFEWTGRDPGLEPLFNVCLLFLIPNVLFKLDHAQAGHDNVGNAQASHAKAVHDPLGYVQTGHAKAHRGLKL